MLDRHASTPSSRRRRLRTRLADLVRAISTSNTAARSPNPHSIKTHTLTRQARPVTAMEEPPPSPPPVGASMREPRADGLERFYDVVIVGTGLVEAMLSAYVHPPLE